MLSSLQLNSCHIERVSVAENDLFDPKTSVQTGNVSIDAGDPEKVSDSVYTVRLAVKVGPSEGEETRIPYVIEASCCGTFRLEQEDDDTRQLLQFNGPAILLGAVRMQIAQLTAMGRFGPLWIPVMNLMPDAQEQPEEAEGAVAAP